MDRLEIRRIGCKQLTDEEQEAKSKYLPTPAEIAAECLVAAGRVLASRCALARGRRRADT